MYSVFECICSRQHQTIDVFVTVVTYGIPEVRAPHWRILFPIGRDWNFWVSNVCYKGYGLSEPLLCIRRVLPAFTTRIPCSGGSFLPAFTLNTDLYGFFVPCIPRGDFSPPSLRVSFGEVKTHKHVVTNLWVLPYQAVQASAVLMFLLV